MNRMSPSKAFIFAIPLLVHCGAGFGQTVEDLLVKGDVQDQQFKPAKALEFYLPAEQQAPKNIGLILRIARQYRHLSADTECAGEKIKLADIGLEYAERAATLAPGEAEAHISVAISYVKMVPILGKKERMAASRQIKIAVDKAIALDPRKDLAWYILGCWHQRLADVGVVSRALASVFYDGLPAASNKDAVECFEEAIRLNPSRLMNYIELGRTFAQMGKGAEARKFIEKGLAMPDVGKDDPDAKKRGQETLKHL